MDAILGPDGSPTAPTHVVERLKQIDPHLDMVWHPSGVSHTWAVVWHWRDLDPRREMIEAGEIPAHSAYDIVCFLPADVSIDDVPGWLSRSQRSTSQEDIRRALDEVHRWNEGVMDRAQSEDEFQDELEKDIMPEVLGGSTITVEMGGTAPPPEDAPPEDAPADIPPFEPKPKRKK